MEQFARISEAEPTGAGKLLVRFIGGKQITLDLAAYARKGGVFVRLSEPEFAASVKIVEKGRVLQWPGDLEFCADALYEKANHSVSQFKLVEEIRNKRSERNRARGKKESKPVSLMSGKPQNAAKKHAMNKKDDVSEVVATEKDNSPKDT